MRSFTSKLLILSILFGFNPNAHSSPGKCSEAVKSEKAIQDDIAKNVFQEMNKSESFRKAKAYAALISVMVASSAVTVTVSSMVSNQYEFLSSFLMIFVGQITTLGVIVVGAPIWEPISSNIRGMVYRHVHPLADNSKGDNSQLEQQFFRTNSMLSLNAQMSRNIFRDYFQTSLENFYHVRQNMLGDYEITAVSKQIVEILTRLSRVYPEINPLDENIVSAIHSGFTNYIGQNQELLDAVLNELKESDANPKLSEIAKAWLVQEL